MGARSARQERWRHGRLYRRSIQYYNFGSVSESSLALATLVCSLDEPTQREGVPVKHIQTRSAIAVFVGLLVLSALVITSCGEATEDTASTALETTTTVVATDSSNTDASKTDASATTPTTVGSDLQIAPQPTFELVTTTLTYQVAPTFGF